MAGYQLPLCLFGIRHSLAFTRPIRGLPGGRIGQWTGCNLCMCVSCRGCDPLITDVWFISSVVSVTRYVFQTRSRYTYSMGQSKQTRSYTGDNLCWAHCEGLLDLNYSEPATETMIQLVIQTSACKHTNRTNMS